MNATTNKSSFHSGWVLLVAILLVLLALVFAGFATALFGAVMFAVGLIWTATATSEDPEKFYRYYTDLKKKNDSDDTTP